MPLASPRSLGSSVWSAVSLLSTHLPVERFNLGLCACFAGASAGSALGFLMLQSLTVRDCFFLLAALGTLPGHLDEVFAVAADSFAAVSEAFPAVSEVFAAATESFTCGRIDGGSTDIRDLLHML